MGTFIAAADNSLWDNGKACGKYYFVKCTGLGGTNLTSNPCKVDLAYVQIVDRCATKGCGTINLS